MVVLLLVFEKKFVIIFITKTDIGRMLDTLFENIQSFLKIFSNTNLGKIGPPLGKWIRILNSPLLTWQISVSPLEYLAGKDWVDLPWTRWTCHGLDRPAMDWIDLAQTG